VLKIGSLSGKRGIDLIPGLSGPTFPRRAMAQRQTLKKGEENGQNAQKFLSEEFPKESLAKILQSNLRPM